MPVEANVHALWGCRQTPVDERQTLTVTGTGNFTLGFEGETTANISATAAASAVKSALVALSAFATEDITAGGGPCGTNPVTLDFVGAYAGQNVSALVPDSTGLTGGTAAVVQTTPGSTGKGATALPTSSEMERLLMVGGDLDAQRTDGSENFSDLDRWGNSWDFVNTIVGQGSPVIEAQADQLAWLLWMFFGGEVFTAKSAAVSPPKYVFEPGASGGFWGTYWKRVGLTDVVRQKFADSLITGLRLEGSTANKVVKATPTLLSLDPGIAFSLGEEPTAAVNLTQAPFIYTEGAAAFKLDGTVYRGHSQFAVVIDDAKTPTYGDDVVPFSIVTGNAAVTLEGVTLQLDEESLARYYAQIYGKTNPVPGDKPIKSVPTWGSYEFTLTRNAADGNADKRLSFKVEIPQVKWSPDLNITPNPDGGAIELAFGGSMRKQAATPKSIRITVETGAGRNTAHA